MGQPERERLIAKIQKIFMDEEPPASITYDTTYADARMLEQALRGKRWTEVADEDIVRYKDDLSLLNSEGFHYYFPAFLVAALRDPDKTDLLIDNIVFQLGFQPNNDESLEPFTLAEQDVVREFLASYLDLFDEKYWHHDNAQLALLDKALKHWTSST